MNNKYKNRRNAVVNPPFEGVHLKTDAQMLRRHAFNVRINQCLSDEVKAYLRDIYRNSNVRLRRAEYDYMVIKHKQLLNSAYGRMVHMVIKHKQLLNSAYGRMVRNVD